MLQIWTFQHNPAPPRSSHLANALKTRLRKAKFMAMGTDHFQHYNNVVAALGPYQTVADAKNTNRYVPNICRFAQTSPIHESVENGHSIDTNFALFHDCPLNDITVQQIPIADISRGAPYQMMIKVREFIGTYLSLTYVLPEHLLETISKQTKIHIQFETDTCAIAGRLNIKHADGLYQNISLFDINDGKAHACFAQWDRMPDADKLEHIWIDLSFEDPQDQSFAMSNITTYLTKNK